ncbi:MAG: DUF2083 domain-containing protein [Inquilinus sp.]|nr:DUF2083 domain-containing protein [Inquilinus sp.]
MLGSKVRRLRRQRGLTQVEMAKRLQLSTSYLNLIEHGRRPLTRAVLAKLDRAFGVDPAAFADDQEVRQLDGLAEVFADPIFRGIGLEHGELRTLVGQSPSTCRAVVELYRAYRDARDDAQALAERLSEGSFLTTSAHELRTLMTSIRSVAEILRDYEDLDARKRRQFVDVLVDESGQLTAVINQMLHLVSGGDGWPALDATTPAAEVDEFIQQHENHFTEIDAVAEALRFTAGVGSPGLYDWLVRHLSTEHGISVEVTESNAEAGPLFRFDPVGRRLLLSELLAPPSRRFQVARQIGLLSFGDIFDRLLAELQPRTGEARAVCRDMLASYFAGALTMPYEPFRQAALESRHDIDRLCARFDASFEQVCHRLCTLQRPGARGVPFHFLRVDVAGNVSKRYTGSGIRIAQSGSVCPRWNVHGAFLSPGTIQRHVLQMPGGLAYFCLARTVAGPGGEGFPATWFAVQIGCEMSRARDMVYSDGFDLGDEGAYVPAGVSCRICERTNCRQRAAAPIFQRFAAGGAPDGDTRH